MMGQRPLCYKALRFFNPQVRERPWKTWVLMQAQIIQYGRVSRSLGPIMSTWRSVVP